jgi:hypothetical protein
MWRPTGARRRRFQSSKRDTTGEAVPAPPLLVLSATAVTYATGAGPQQEQKHPVRMMLFGHHRTPAGVGNEWRARQPAVGARSMICETRGAAVGGGGRSWS